MRSKGLYLIARLSETLRLFRTGGSTQPRAGAFIRSRQFWRPSAAQEDLVSMSCGDLWYRRNEIFARNGYCFKTDRAIRIFGNQGCRFYVEADVPISRAEREEVEIIRAIERRKGCEA